MEAVNWGTSRPQFSEFFQVVSDSLCGNCRGLPVRTSTAKGSDFEKQVEQLLVLMGYAVTRNNLINGTQIDLTAQKQDLLNNLTLVVECADRGEPIGVDLVKQKAAVLLSLHNAGSLYRMLFVARNGFTAEAKSFASSQSNLLLLKPSQLEARLVDFTPYANWFTYNYSRSEGLFKDARLHERYVELAARDEEGLLSPSLAKEVAQWLGDDSNNLLFLLGEYGSGKTSFCRQFAYDLLNRKYIEGLDERFTPVLINLRDYRRAFNIQQVITDTLVNQYGVSLPSFMAFERLCGTGSVLLMLDGFDEMADRCDDQTLVNSFSQIFLLASVDAKVIVTCRSNVFKHHSDVIALLKQFSVSVPIKGGKEVAQVEFSRHGKIVHVEKLNENQVREFISKRFGSKSDSVFTTISSVHDLSDLATRPVLLDMMLTTLPALIDSGQRINSAALYQHYVDRWAARDAWRVHTPQSVRDQFCETLAWLMHTRYVKELKFPLLESLMTGSIAGVARTDESISAFRHDIQICSFLVGPGPTDSFRFAHKSFLEFLVARKLAKQLSRGEVVEKAPSLIRDDPPFLSGLTDSLFSSGTTMSRIVLSLERDLSTHLRLADFHSYRAGHLAIRPTRRASSEAEESAITSVIEDQLHRIFDKRLPSDEGARLGISEEIATFAVEYLENQKTSFAQLLATVTDPKMIELLADLLRLSKSVEYIRANLDVARKYVARADSGPLAVGLYSAMARVPGLVTIEFLEEARRHLNTGDWSYLLFDIAKERKHSSLLTEVSDWPDLGVIERVICAYGRSPDKPGDESALNSSMLLQVAKSELTKSSDPKDVRVGLALCPFVGLPTSELSQMMLDVISRTNDDGIKQEAASILSSLRGEPIWRAVRFAAAKQSDAKTRALLEASEKKIRDATSKTGAQMGGSQSNQMMRDRLWRALRR